MATKTKSFSGGLDKPIQYCVKVIVTDTDMGFRAVASWPFINGRCSVNMELVYGVCSFANYTVSHPGLPSLELAMQQKGLQPDEKEYLEDLFRQTILMDKEPV